MGEQRTCAERIGEQYEGRMEDIRALMGAIGVTEMDDITVEMVSAVTNTGPEDIRPLYRCACGAEGADPETVEHAEDCTEYPELVSWDAAGEVVDDSERFREAAMERLQEYPLAVSMRRIIRVELSWGGPQDYFEAEYDPEDRTASGVTYHFLDWFDGAEMPAKDSEAEDFVNYFAEVASLDD